MLGSTAQFPDFDLVVSQVPGQVGPIHCKNSCSTKFTSVANGNTKAKLAGKRKYFQASNCYI